MEFKTNYPYVFVHGMFGYGPGSKLYEYVPYFGVFGGSVVKYFNDNGIEAYDTAVGPFSSAWDRACELYAQLTGTRVDYGKVHSERYGHERYGRTYDRPVLPNWGNVDDNGQVRKVNLIGHSFGGTTIRLLTCLLAEGCEAERNATDPSELSPLFVGGKANWVYSVTTYSAPHNGMTLIESLGSNERKIKKAIFTIANKTANTAFCKFYDFKLDQFGLTTDPYTTFKSEINPTKVSQLVESQDTVFYDISIDGAKVVNSHLYCVPNVYYFSYAGSRTKSGMLSKVHKPNRDMFFALKFASKRIGAFKENPITGIDLDSDWLENDGIVNTYSATAPFTEPATDFNIVKDVKPGIWYKMGILDMDHGSFCGLGISSADICEMYYNHAIGLNNLNTGV